MINPLIQDAIRLMGKDMDLFDFYEWCISNNTFGHQQDIPQKVYEIMKTPEAKAIYEAYHIEEYGETPW